MLSKAMHTAPMEGWEVNPDMPYSSVSPNFPKFITWLLTVNGDINNVSTSCCCSKQTGGSNSSGVMGVNVDHDVGILFPDSTNEPEKLVSAILCWLKANNPKYYGDVELVPQLAQLHSDDVPGEIHTPTALGCCRHGRAIVKSCRRWREKPRDQGVE